MSTFPLFYSHSNNQNNQSTKATLHYTDANTFGKGCITASKVQNLKHIYCQKNYFGFHVLCTLCLQASLPSVLSLSFSHSCVHSSLDYVSSLCIKFCTYVDIFFFTSSPTSPDRNIFSYYRPLTLLISFSSDLPSGFPLTLFSSVRPLSAINCINFLYKYCISKLPLFPFLYFLLHS